MAENDSTETYDLIEEDGQVKLSERRARIALEAVSEIEQLCLALRKVAGPPGDDLAFTVRGISKRIQDLSCAVMSALTDREHPTSDLFFEVCLEECNET